MDVYPADFWTKIFASLFCGGVIGLGFLREAVALVLVSVAILSGVEHLENRTRKQRCGEHARSSTDEELRTGRKAKRQET
jgi:uncharacterized membrane protein YhiD involved in acid resistance